MTIENDQDLEKLTRVRLGLPSSDTAPFERPAETIEKGPLFVNVEERMPELAEPESSKSATATEPRLAVDRRDFMRLFSASAALASTAACMRRPVEKVVPYVDQPIDQAPGIAVNYATSGGGPLANGLIVRTREGRPTKIEGNPEHPLSQGATNHLDQAALQALYHPERRKAPTARYGNQVVSDVTWEEAYGAIADRLKEAGGKVAILTSGSTGSKAKFYKTFLKHVGASADNLYTYEPNSLYAEIDQAHQLAFGLPGIPRTDLRRTKYILGIGSDFIDMGIANVYETKSYSSGHAFRFGRKGKFVQFESRLTLTGAKATDRRVIGVGDELAVGLLVVEKLVAESNAKGSKAEQDEIKAVLAATSEYRNEAKQRLGLKDDDLQSIAKELLEGRSLVMMGSSGTTSPHGTRIQMVAIMANILIGAYGKTIHFDRGWINTPVKSQDLKRFIDDVKNFDLVFVVDANPAFDVPASTGMMQALKGVKTLVSAQVVPNETDLLASITLNNHHFLESWGDAHTVAGFWSTQQPVVRPAFNSQQFEDVLLWVAAKMNKPMGFASYRKYIETEWKAIHSMVQAKVDFDTFYRAILRRGFVGKLEKRTFDSMKTVSKYFSGIKAPEKGLKLAVHLDSRLYAGYGAALPVLQEAGDPITTVAWDTWAAINPNTAKKLGLRYNELVNLETSQGAIKVSIYPLPGLAPDTVAIPRGNGHKDVNKASNGVGVDPLPLLAASFDGLSGQPVTSGMSVKISSTKQFYRLCAMQKHNDLANRTDIVKTVKLSDAAKNIKKKKDLDNVPDLFPDLEKGDYSWGLAIDLDKCTGCGVCMVACAQENNVAQVGRTQILMGREMHWIRLDRYFGGEIDNPSVSIQPVMCQHCNHAPCEAVCPVFATTHDKEGMNAMTYNRCVGTRYCANACPYKVRRFNWFTNKWNIVGDAENDRNIRALNPDVTVRTKGVMEKCSFCVQRLREAKHKAKERGPKARVGDGEVKVACQQACPSDAIDFGNLQDKRSRISRQRKDNRAYLMLGGDPEHKHYGLKTLPSVSYLAQVVHDNSSADAHHGQLEQDGHGHSHGHGHGHGGGGEHHEEHN